MRLNQFIAQATGMSRRAADRVIQDGRIAVNGTAPSVGQQVSVDDTVLLDNRPIIPTVKAQTIILNKPVGYVCSRDGQGSPTVYELLPPELYHLKPIGRLDKASSGLLLMTTDGQLAYELTHPKFQKTKVYEVEIDHPLSEQDFNRINTTGVNIGDGKPSQFQLVACSKQYVVSKQAAANPYYFLPATCCWRATLAEGRNRQIRRTFEALGYNVIKLHRTQFGKYSLNGLPVGHLAIFN